MILQIDVTNKTIKLDANIKFVELVETLDKMFPNLEWHSFTLISNPNIVINTPTIIYRDIWTNPWKYPWIRYDVSNEDQDYSNQSPYQLNSGIYNVEL